MRTECSEYEHLCRRHGELIDAKYLRGLTDAEQTELSAVIDRIDELEQPLYEAIFESISAQLRLDD